MVDNKFTRNILILLVGIVLIIVAVIIANITYQVSLKRSAEKDTLKSETSDSAAVQVEEPKSAPEADLYETCVLISTDKNIVLNNREILSLNGYPVKIKESQRANKLIYSLIIDKQLSREDAILLGEEIKDKYMEITSYWIEKISDEIIEDTPEKTTSEEQISFLETKAESVSTNNTKAEDQLADANREAIQYEVQIMANTDLEKITATQKFLESEGYKIKIVEFVKNGLTYYRLRLVDKYNKPEAELIGSELKQKYKFINSYWLDKVE